MDMNKSRRDFLRTTGKGLLGVARRFYAACWPEHRRC